MAGIIDRISNNIKVNFDSLELQNEIKKKLGTPKIARGDLSKITRFSYNAKGDELTQNDIDLLSKYCNFDELSISNINLENKNIERLNVKELRFDYSKLKGTNLGNLNSKALTIRECNDFEINQLSNVEAQDLTISYISSKNDFKTYKTLSDLDKLKNLERLHKLNLVGIINIQDLKISENVKSLGVNNCDINNLEVLNKFNFVKNIAARDNPYTDISPILQMKNLQSFDAEDSNLGVENIELLAEFENAGGEIYITKSRTPLDKELNRRKEEKINQERENEKLDISNPELLTYLKTILSKENQNCITETDLKEFVSIHNDNFTIPSNLVTEFIYKGLSKNLDINKLTIELNDKDNFDIEQFLTNTNKDYGQLTFKLNTPSLDLPEKDIKLLESRYGITYDVYGENYHIDELQKMQKQIDDLIPEFPQNSDDFEKTRIIYDQINKNIEFVEAKFVNYDFSGIKMMTSTNQVVAGGKTIMPEKEDPNLQKLNKILVDKKANDYGMNLLLNSMLTKAGLEVKLKDDTTSITFKDTNQTFSKQIKSNEVKINNIFYDIKLNKDNLDFEVCEKQDIDIQNNNESKKEISSDEIKTFTSDVPKKEMQEMLGTFIKEIDEKKLGDKHEEI